MKLTLLLALKFAPQMVYPQKLPREMAIRGTDDAYNNSHKFCFHMRQNTDNDPHRSHRTN